MSIPINIIAALDIKNGIGIRSLSPRLPWKLTKEWQHFLHLTMKTVEPNKPKVAWIMGRKSYKDHFHNNEGFVGVEEKRKIVAIVLSKKGICHKSHNQPQENFFLCSNWNQVLSALDRPDVRESVYRVWNIGGPDIYREQLKFPLHKSTKMYITHIHKDFECDMFFPMVNFENWQICENEEIMREVQEENGVKFRFCVYQQY